MAQINILLGYRPPLLRGSVQGPEDGNEDDQGSVICFLEYKTFNHLVVFIYNGIKILILILVLRSPPPSVS